MPLELTVASGIWQDVARHGKREKSFASFSLEKNTFPRIHPCHVPNTQHNKFFTFLSRNREQDAPFVSHFT